MKNLKFLQEKYFLTARKNFHKHSATVLGHGWKFGFLRCVIELIWKSYFNSLVL